MPSVSHDVMMAETFRKDPEYALYLLQDVLADCEPMELLVLLRQLRVAFQGVKELSEEQAAGIIAAYRKNALGGTESVATLTATLNAMGLGLAVGPMRNDSEQVDGSGVTVDIAQVA